MNQPHTIMKSASLLFIIPIIVFILSAFKTTNEQIDHSLQLIGINKQQGAGKIKNSFLQGYLDYYGLQTAKKIVVANRAAVATDLLQFAKIYVGSDEFAKAYAEYKALLQPEAPKPARNAEAIKKELIASTKEAIANAEKSKAAMPAEYHKALQEAIDQLKQQLAEYEKPENDLIRIMADGERQQFEWNTADHQAKLKDWQKVYPENARLFVKQQLQLLLSRIKDVDYNAALREESGRKKFVNPAYESKPDEWKLLFRAGKEVGGVVIPFLQQWVAEIK